MVWKLQEDKQVYTRHGHKVTVEIDVAQAGDTGIGYCKWTVSSAQDKVWR